MDIRSARPDDAPVIAEIYIRAWQSAFAGIIPRHYLDGMDLAAETAGWDETLRAARWPKAGALVAEEEADVTGFAGFGPARESPATAELSTLYALPIAWPPARLLTGASRRGSPPAASPSQTRTAVSEHYHHGSRHIQDQLTT
ncbi:hypothetical protein GCM10028832_01350 [Streptomyces sparsus]